MKPNKDIQEKFSEIHFPYDEVEMFSAIQKKLDDKKRKRRGIWMFFGVLFTSFLLFGIHYFTNTEMNHKFSDLSSKSEKSHQNSIKGGSSSKNQESVKTVTNQTLQTTKKNESLVDVNSHSDEQINLIDRNFQNKVVKSISKKSSTSSDELIPNIFSIDQDMLPSNSKGLDPIASSFGSKQDSVALQLLKKSEILEILWLTKPYDINQELYSVEPLTKGSSIKIKIGAELFYGFPNSSFSYNSGVSESNQFLSEGNIKTEYSYGLRLFSALHLSRNLSVELGYRHTYHNYRFEFLEQSTIGLPSLIINDNVNRYNDLNIALNKSFQIRSFFVQFIAGSNILISTQSRGLLIDDQGIIESNDNYFSGSRGIITPYLGTSISLNLGNRNTINIGINRHFKRNIPTIENYSFLTQSTNLTLSYCRSL